MDIEIDELLNDWATSERTGDANALDRLLTDDFVGIGPVGFQLPKPAWLQRQTSGDLHYDELHLDEITTRQYGDCAVTTARWNARRTA
jgi:ketosteroid isomerase-like protein